MVTVGYWFTFSAAAAAIVLFLFERLGSWMAGAIGCVVLMLGITILLAMMGGPEWAQVWPFAFMGFAIGVTLCVSVETKVWKR